MNWERYEVDVSHIQEIYGLDVVERMEESWEDVEQNAGFLLELGFGEMVTDVFHRYAPILLLDCWEFRQAVEALIRRLGADYVEILGEDMSHWEDLM